MANRALVLLGFAASMGQVGEDSLHDPVGGVGVAQVESLLVVFLGFFVVLLLVVDDSQLRVD